MPRGAANDAFVVDEQSGSRESCLRSLLVDELVDALARDGNAEQEEPESTRQLVGVAEPSQVGRATRATARGARRRSRAAPGFLCGS